MSDGSRFDQCSDDERERGRLYDREHDSRYE